MSQVLVSLSPRQLARLGRHIAASALTIELAAERGDWETIHQGHAWLIALYEEYRATYTNLLVQGAHRPAREELRSGGESAGPQEKAETFSAG
jgi:hypothetical protein